MLSLHFQGASLFRIELIPFEIFPKAIKLLDQQQLEIFKHGFNESCSRLGDARFLKTTWRAYVAARHPIVDFRRATSLYRRDSAQSAELLGSIFASGNMPYIMKGNSCSHRHCNGLYLIIRYIFISILYLRLSTFFVLFFTCFAGQFARFTCRFTTRF